jgi:hypothetical protein
LHLSPLAHEAFSPPSPIAEWAVPRVKTGSAWRWKSGGEMAAWLENRQELRGSKGYFRPIFKWF